MEAKPEPKKDEPKAKEPPAPIAKEEPKPREEGGRSRPRRHRGPKQDRENGIRAQNGPTDSSSASAEQLGDRHPEAQGEANSSKKFHGRNRRTVEP